MLANCGTRFLAGAVCSALWLMTMTGRPAMAEIIYVPADYPTIQEAINEAAEEGDEIIVAPDTYNEAIDFLGKAIWLHSSDGPEVTIIDGEGLNTSVVTCASGEGPGTTLEGFTITNGHAEKGGGMYNSYSSPTVTHCTFIDNIADAEGGGMYNDHCGTTVWDCTFSRNRAVVGLSYGGGMSSRHSQLTVTNCMFDDNSAIWGGGVHSCIGALTLTGCTFIDNSADWGAGVMNDGTLATIADCVFTGHHGETGNWGEALHDYADSDSLVIDCVFIDNQCTGMAVGSSSPTVMECTFMANSSHRFGGGMHNWEDANPTVVNCTFIANSAGEDGGGMYNDFFLEPTVINCAFIGNTAERGGGMFNRQAAAPAVMHCTFIGNLADLGGGMYNLENWTNTQRVTNCAFAANEAVVTGGGIYCGDESSMVVANCTFASNAAPTGRTLACDSEHYPSNVSLADCILWNGSGEVWNNDGSVITITYSCINDGYEGEGNIDADPLFIDPENGDYRLSSGSPCIDAADNTSVPPDEFDLDEDGNTVEPIPVDLDWNPRFVDDPDTEDTGNGEPPIVDMGAYEYQAGECPADFDGDGDVDTADLLHLLGCWGTPCGDVDGDGDTDTADLLALLGAWGECP